MILEFHAPSGELAPYVQVMVYHEGYSPSHRIERFLPDGSVDLVIDLTDDDKYLFDNDSLAPTKACRASWVSGMRTGFISISAGDGSSMMVVNFRAVGAGLFFHVPLHEIADQVLDAESVLGSSVVALRERLRGLPTPADRFRAVEGWLLRRLRLAENGYHLAAAAARIIETSPQMATIDSVARGAGVSCKHLVSVFREHAGVTPKQYQRIKRFQVVVARIEKSQTVDWAQVALESGFYDQAHLIREFRHYSGMTPTQYVESRGQVLNYIPVA